MNNPCIGVTPSPSSLSDHLYKIDQIYKINSLAKTYTFAAFSMSPSVCPVTYSFSTDNQPVTNQIMTLDSPTHTFTFESSSLNPSLVGTYEVTVTGVNFWDNTKSATSSFTFYLVSKYCFEATFTFDPVFVDKTYQFPLDPISYAWTPPPVTADTFESVCGPLRYDIRLYKGADLVTIGQSDFWNLFTLD